MAHRKNTHFITTILSERKTVRFIHCLLAKRLYLGRLAMSFILDSHSHTFIALLLSEEKETETPVRGDVPVTPELCTDIGSSGVCTEQRELLIALRSFLDLVLS
ncbi:hypothetical protein PROFUN_03169 [Planoprotostelium fungivorum]|uniref:Uncharacterized protein n=1 Tax=Planoprotostelium fungivorum TaxID=1890364 RepID=A0A2P6NWW3_9EUKA|nr:hypothetical protein PROFUN_03169 [Planoprotostelium fungivorum]